MPKEKPPIIDAEFEVIDGPEPPNIVDKLASFLKRYPIAIWVLAAVAAALQRAGSH